MSSGFAEAFAAHDVTQLREAFAQGADPNARDEEGVPYLLLAAETGDVARVTCFLDAGAEVDLDDGYGMTALFAAVGEGQAEVCAVLLDRGASLATPEGGIGADEETALLRGMGSPRAADVMRVLLAAGADPNEPRPDGWTPLMCAAVSDDVAQATLLLEAGAQPHLGPPGRTPLELADHRQLANMQALLARWGAPAPLALAIARQTAIWEEIGAWMEEHAPPLAERLRSREGSPDVEIARAEETLGRPMPTDLRGHFRLHGGKGCAQFFSYGALSLAQALRTWEGLEGLRRTGAFDAFAPRELAEGEDRVRNVWWHTAWVPFAEDGGGNLLVVDLAPEDDRWRGQVLYWEIHAGPVGPVADSLEEYLESYRDRLHAGRGVFDPDAGLSER